MNPWCRIPVRSAVLAGLAACLAVTAPAETLAEKSLVEIAERQRDIFVRAEKDGDHLDEAALRGELESLIKSYDVLIQKNPDFALAFGGYGMFLGKIGMTKEAVIMLLRANKLDPGLPEVKNQIAVHLAEDGRPVDALPWVTAAIDLEPNKALYHFHLGELLAAGRGDFLKTGQFDDSKLDQTLLDAFQKAAELSPRDFPIAYRHAKAYYDLAVPRWAEALPVWEKVEDLAATDAQRQLVRLQRANVLLKLGRPVEAKLLLDSVTSQEFAAEKKTLLDGLPKPEEK
jgi:tetratricopeptide (TPR) repeat protein